MENNHDIIIIGAGISGLICAIELEKAGLSPTIIEKSSHVGGRLNTSFHNNIPMDHGFQVLLTNYPEAKKYLDYNTLDLKYFEPGAIIFDGDKSFEISDPLRQKSSVFNMLFSPVGSFSDKIKLATLALKIKKKSTSDIFSSPSKTTLQFLKGYGFSDKIISNFFKPFFGGIFLENKLQTSSRMFEFVFKMFTEGSAAIPKNGIVAIANQLRSTLKKTTFRFETEVEKVDDKIHLKNGEILQPDKVVITTQPEFLMNNLETIPDYQSVTNIYFKTTSPVFTKAKIGLVTNTDFLINNFYEVSSLLDNSEHIISVSVNRQNDFEIDQITSELSQLTGLASDQFRHIKTFEIKNALPVVDDLKMKMEPSAAKLHDKIILAGDYLLNGSLNAAMQSGRTAAEAVLGSW